MHALSVCFPTRWEMEAIAVCDSHAKTASSVGTSHIVISQYVKSQEPETSRRRRTCSRDCWDSECRLSSAVLLSVQSSPELASPPLPRYLTIFEEPQKLSASTALPCDRAVHCTRCQLPPVASPSARTVPLEPAGTLPQGRQILLRFWCSQYCHGWHWNCGWHWGAGGLEECFRNMVQIGIRRHRKTCLCHSSLSH